MATKKKSQGKGVVPEVPAASEQKVSEKKAAPLKNVLRLPILHRDPAMQFRQVLDNAGKVKLGALIVINDKGETHQLFAFAPDPEPSLIPRLIGELEIAKHLLTMNATGDDLLDLLEDLEEEHRQT